MLSFNLQSSDQSLDVNCYLLYFRIAPPQLILGIVLASLEIALVAMFHSNPFSNSRIHGYAAPALWGGVGV